MKKENSCIIIVFIALTIFFLLKWENYIIFVIWPISGLNFMLSMQTTTRYLKNNEPFFYEQILKGDVFMVYFLSNNIENISKKSFSKIKYLRMCFYSAILPFLAYIVFIVIQKNIEN